MVGWVNDATNIGHWTCYNLFMRRNNKVLNELTPMGWLVVGGAILILIVLVIIVVLFFRTYF